MKIDDFHRVVVGENPKEMHTKLYSSGKLGFDDKTLDEDRFLPVTVLTLHKAMRKSMKEPARVILFLPPRRDEWVMTQLKGISRNCFNLIKKMAGSPTARGEMAKVVGGCFDVLFISSRLLQLPEQPEAWTSFGFSKEDPIPDWMREGLLSL